MGLISCDSFSGSFSVSVNSHYTFQNSTKHSKIKTNQTQNPKKSNWLPHHEQRLAPLSFWPDLTAHTDSPRTNRKSSNGESVDHIERSTATARHSNGPVRSARERRLSHPQKMSQTRRLASAEDHRRNVFRNNLRNCHLFCLSGRQRSGRFFDQSFWTDCYEHAEKGSTPVYLLDSAWPELGVREWLTVLNFF